MKNLVVFGGTGYLGYNWLRDFDHEYDSIFIISRNNNKSFLFSSTRIHLISDIALLDKGKPIDIVVLSYALSDTFVQTYRQNVAIINDVTNLIKLHQVMRLVHLSSIVVSDLSDNGPNSIVKISFRNLYVFAKTIQEKRIRKLYKKYGIPTLIIRSGNIVGPGSVWLMLPMQYYSLNKKLIYNGQVNHYMNAVTLRCLVDRISDSLVQEMAGLNLITLADMGGMQWSEFAERVYGVKVLKNISVDSRLPSERTWLSVVYISLVNATKMAVRNVYNHRKSQWLAQVIFSTFGSNYKLVGKKSLSFNKKIDLLPSERDILSVYNNNRCIHDSGISEEYLSECIKELKQSLFEAGF